MRFDSNLLLCKEPSFGIKYVVFNNFDCSGWLCRALVLRFKQRQLPHSVQDKGRYFHCCQLLSFFRSQIVRCDIIYLAGISFLGDLTQITCQQLFTLALYFSVGN